MLAAVASVLWVGTALAASISGVVTNRTTGKPAGGDVVTLIKLAQGMQEAGSTKTDARGRFTLDVPDDGIHLVRVNHEKANYFQAVDPSKTSVDVDVFTAAAKVVGLVSEAEVLHVQTDPGGNMLDVVASYFVKNTSSPPMTQFSDRAFEFYLPAGAVVEGSIALGPGKMSMPVKTPPVPLGDVPDHYAFIFPLRPCVGDAAKDTSCGETRFQVTFHLPYSGSLNVAPKVAMPTDTVAVMLPKSMSFKQGTGATYTAAAEETNAQAFVARDVQPSEPMGFTISGSGQLPRDTQASGTQGAGATGAPSNTSDLTPSEASARQRADLKPGVGLNNPLDSDGDLEPWSKYKWWILGVLGLALAGGAGVMLKATPAGASAVGTAPVAALPVATMQGVATQDAATQGAAGGGALLQALKDELFALETDRLSGKLSEAHYGEQKMALEIVLRRALARSGAGEPRVEG